MEQGNIGPGPGERGKIRLITDQSWKMMEEAGTKTKSPRW